ncbi:MAG TPA: DUF1707 domain-containing protein [Trebonia sp.]|jgi:hypothetical protein|nr:DUF1707 domain-containing protein [Trebonia sp.]
MSPASTQQWTRRIRYSDQHIRVSDADRNAVAELLTQHYAEGRLDQGEFDERVGRTMAAKTRGDLAGLFDDLPDTDSAGAGGPGSPAGRPAVPYRASRRRGGMLRSLLVVALVLICANIAWHAFTSVFFIGPLAWAAVLVVVIALLAKSRRH